MRCQRQIAWVLPVALAACGKAVPVEMSAVSTHMDAADLSLRGVAFARVSVGRMVARGISARVDYRRAGGRLDGSQSILELVPEPGSELSVYGNLRFQAPSVAGEIANRHGSAWGGVTVDAERGDHGRTDAVEYDGTRVWSRSRVSLRGPGYQVEGMGFTALADGSRIELGQGVRGQLQMEARR
jgi:hypothetical protein